MLVWFVLRGTIRAVTETCRLNRVYRLKRNEQAVMSG